jgi:four helix bundle protein
MNRISDKEKAHFLGFAYASMMEVDSQLDVSVDLGYLTLEQYNIVEEKIDRIARQLLALRSKYNN